jgi:hypothetical protein
MSDRLLTIPGFESLSRQELFDISVAHIASTRKASLGTIPGESGDRCVYSGIGCAAAPFLREECREKADTVGSWGILTWEKYAPEVNRDLVKELQNCHDAAWDKNAPDPDRTFMLEWKRRMGYVAQNYGLDTTKLFAVEVE